MAMAANEGQHCTTQDLLTNNARDVLLDILRHLEAGIGTNVNLDYVRYRLEWLIAVIARFGQSYEKEATIAGYLQSALSCIATLEIDGNTGNFIPPVISSHNRGRPKFDIPCEQLQLYLDYGFTVNDIAKILCVSSKTVHRRMHGFGLSVRGTYSAIDNSQLDDVVRSISHEFPNCGYKTMRGHLLSRGIRVQENRVRESLRRTDPEGTAIRALQLKVTHRRVYSVRGPLALWHLDGNHKLIR